MSILQNFPDDYIILLEIKFKIPSAREFCMSFSKANLCFINEYICFIEPRNLNSMLLFEFIGMNITHNFATIGFGHMPFPKGMFEHFRARRKAIILKFTLPFWE